MAKFISLLNWTEQGIRSVKDTVKRTEAARQLFKTKNSQLLNVYWTIGQYDLIVVFEAPDAETASQLLMVLGMQGNLRSSTLQAFDEVDMGRIIPGLP